MCFLRKVFLFKMQKEATELSNIQMSIGQPLLTIQAISQSLLFPKSSNKQTFPLRNSKIFVSRVAKIPKNLYDGRVRKVSVFAMLFFLLFVIAQFFHNRTYAQASSPCSQWGGWNGEKYVPIPNDRIGEYFKNGQLKPNQNVTCINIDTAIGPISTEPQGFVRSIFSLVLGLAGGIALILIILSGYRFMASQGNPEALTNARQQLISAIVGLLFIIFSFVILQIIGVDILRIPGFAP